MKNIELLTVAILKEDPLMLIRAMFQEHSCDLYRARTGSKSFCEAEDSYTCKECYQKTEEWLLSEVTYEKDN